MTPVVRVSQGISGKNDRVLERFLPTLITQCPQYREVSKFDAYSTGHVEGSGQGAGRSLGLGAG
jgi:hypothetical protein